MLAGRYEREREIGRGGMGTVWLGRDATLGRTVAIKQIGMAAGAGTPDVERAEREARLAARVNHQHVVAVYDLVFDEGHQWLVMEYVDGPSLAGRIAEQGALSAEELEPVVEQIAGALGAAHRHGIVHRDVKPSNILLTRDGLAKLSDFGIARAEADAALTQTGLLTGSPAYLSPEVVTGRTATAASDVWSLGATVFHALAGRPPYDMGENPLAAMHRIVHDEPPRLAGHGDLGSLVEAMMQQDPDARPSMVDVQSALAEEAPGRSDVPGGTPAPTAVTEATKPSSEATTAFSPLDPPSDGSARDVSRDSTPRGLWLAAAAAMVVIVVVVSFVIGSRDSPADDPAAGDSASTSPSRGSEEPDEEAPSPDGTTAQALEGFAADYLTAADNDPETGFSMLTPEYQRTSGGIEGYLDFWGEVEDLDVQSLEADPQELTVSYTYSYMHDGQQRTEDVTLQLVEADGSFLVSGAS